MSLLTGVVFWRELSWQARRDEGIGDESKTAEFAALTGCLSVFLIIYVTNPGVEQRTMVYSPQRKTFVKPV